MKRLKKIVTEDQIVKQLQNNIEQVLSPMIDKQILDGILLRDIVLTTGSVDKVEHKLGRTALGYIIVKKNANSIIWNSDIDNKTIDLNCSANVTVSIWVF